MIVDAGFPRAVERPILIIPGRVLQGLLTDRGADLGLLPRSDKLTASSVTRSGVRLWMSSERVL